MKLGIFAVRDSAMDAYMRPFMVAAAGVAIREFVDECSRKESQFFAHPEDFELFELGAFDDVTGGVVALSPPRSLFRGKDVVNKE